MCVGAEYMSLLGIVWAFGEEVQQVFIVAGIVGAFVCISTLDFVEVVVERAMAGS